MTPFLAAALPGLIGVAGSVLGRAQSQGDINRMNRYNSPVNQLARLREAGLPHAAFANSQAGSQSMLPITSADKAGGHLSQYMQTQTQLKQLQILEEEIRLKRSEADKNTAEVKYLLEGQGQDSQGTNLTRGLKTQYEIDRAGLEGQTIDNRVQSIIESNTRSRLHLENTKMIGEIQNALKHGDLIDKQIEGADIDNQIKQVIAAYQPSMSNAELTKLLKGNNLIQENIYGARLDNALSVIRNRIAEATEQAEVNKANVSSWLAGLSYDRVKAEFDDYQEYQKFVQAGRDWVNDPGKFGVFDSMGAFIKFLYTSVTAPTGQASGQILNGVGGGAGSINTGERHYHFSKD